MPLIVAGDFAWPSQTCVNIDDIVSILSSFSLVINLEGPILDNYPEFFDVKNDLKFNLYSVVGVFDILKRLNVFSLCLSNNHIGDYVGACGDTIDLIRKHKLSFFGIERFPYVDLQYEGLNFRFVGAVSPITEITCDSDGLTANTLSPGEMLHLIKSWRDEASDLKIIVFAHWGYELARYPLPADRSWAHQAIHAGADFVIGHHPHVVQGIEKVGKGIIAYSLGNFILPQVNYRGRNLTYFDQDVKTQLAITLENDPQLVWMKFDTDNNIITVTCREQLSDSSKISELTPFSGMTEMEYREWFKNSVKNGTANFKRGQAILWSYVGAWRIHVAGVFQYLRIRRLIRSLLIRMRLHRPYNW
jgi:poly-gamma-glutamate synthesis protein (capsule biosynthesis protein)